MSLESNIETISLPDPRVFTPRDYQKPFFHALADPKITRLMLIWHRRAGKDWAAMNGVAYLVGEVYAHKAINVVALAGKSKTQGGNILWDNRTNDGLSYIDAFPKELVDRVDNRDFSVHFKNGSVFKILTTRDPDIIRGANPTVVLISEYDYIDGIQTMFQAGVSPILQQNGGKCIITTTPAGAKGAYVLYLRNRESENWLVELRGAEHTLHNGQRVLTDKMIEESRLDGMSEAQIQREYYCNFFSEGEDTFFEHEFERIREEKRVCRVHHDPELPVHTAWDLGRDMTSIWFFQVTKGGEWRWIDYYHNTKTPFSKSLGVLTERRRKYDYNYGLHCAPHDFKHENIRSELPLHQQAKKQGYRFITSPKLNDKMIAINAARNILDRSIFDAAKTYDGVEALKHYRRQPSKFEDRYGHPILSEKPLHDDASHPSDALQTAALLKDKIERYMRTWYSGYGKMHGQNVQTQMASKAKENTGYGFNGQFPNNGRGNTIVIPSQLANQYLQQPPSQLGYNAGNDRRGL